MTSSKKPDHLWLAKLGGRFLARTPGLTTSVYFLNLVTQITLLVSFLLPLKVVMLMGAEGIPRFLPDYFSQFDKQNLILGLSLLAVSFYLINIVAQKASDSALKSATRKILSDIDKVPLFENQNSIAESAYQKFLEIASQLSFFSFALIAVFYLYPDLGFVNLSVFIAITIYFLTARSYSHDPEKKRRKMSNLGKLRGLGFLIAFAYIVSDYLFFSPANLLFALLSLIITRQSLAKVINSYRFMDQIYDQRHKISSIFLEHQPLTPPTNAKDNSFWALLEPGQLTTWLLPLLTHSSDSEGLKIDSYQWVPAGLKNIICLKVTTSRAHQAFLVKVFHNKLAQKALHEAALLLDKPAGLPSVPLLKSTMVNGFHCHVFELTDADPGLESLPRQSEAQFKEKLSGIRPPEQLEKRFRKSFHLLPERLNQGIFQRLELIAEPEEKPALERLASELPKLKALLAKKAMTIVSEPKKEQLIKSREGEILSFHWVDWRVEPCGVGTPIPGSSDSERVNGRPPEADQNVPSNNTKIVAALTSQFEKHFIQQQYRSALNLIPSILQCMEGAETHSHSKC